jgi:hypothetical protein
LQANDPDFRASLADFHSFVEELSNKIIEVDDTIPELPLKDIVRVATRNQHLGLSNSNCL